MHQPRMRRRESSGIPESLSNSGNVWNCLKWTCVLTLNTDVTCSTKHKACSIAYTYTRSCSDVWMRNQKTNFRNTLYSHCNLWPHRRAWYLLKKFSSSSRCMTMLIVSKFNSTGVHPQKRLQSALFTVEISSLRHFACLTSHSCLKGKI